jgi:peroxin-19
MSSSAETPSVPPADSQLEAEDDLDQLLDSALDDFDKPSKSRNKASAAEPSGRPDDSAEAELLQLFEKAGLSAAASDSRGLQEDLEKLARLAGSLAEKETGPAAAPDPDVSLKAMMQQLSADTERLGEALSEAELNTMFQHLQAGSGGGGPEDLEKLIPMMEGMMQSLLSKDLLYPAIKDMNDRFPDWLADQRPRLSAEDFARYNKQYEKTRLICREFEEEDEGRATEAEKSARFQRVMHLMQASGRFCFLTVG